jgi:hypothetical protein
MYVIVFLPLRNPKQFATINTKGDKTGLEKANKMTAYADITISADCRLLGFVLGIASMCCLVPTVLWLPETDFDSDSSVSLGFVHLILGLYIPNACNL